MPVFCKPNSRRPWSLALAGWWLLGCASPVAIGAGITDGSFPGDGPRGCEEKFQPTPMRYIRIGMFGNILNEGNI